jgi:ATP synthase protein I
MGIAFRFATELGAALFVGAGLGWLIDHFLHTSPFGLIVMFVLGAAAGIRNVMRAAAELNARAAAFPATAVKDEDEET